MTACPYCDQAAVTVDGCCIHCGADRTHDDETTTVEIPGTFAAIYRAGRIERLAFSPLGSYAGYFGPAAIVVDGNDALEVDSTDGPFWRAVQRALHPTTWVQVAAPDVKDPPEHAGPAVPIDWTE